LEAFGDERDWDQEEYEEMLDAVVYKCAAQLRRRRLMRAVAAMDAYAGAAGEVSVSPLGTIAVPVRLFQELRLARRGEG